jgi:RimJ/RimL family protein N-acetyltransferase
VTQAKTRPPRAPEPQSWRGQDRAGDAILIRQGLPRDAPRFVEHTNALVGETDFMLQCREDDRPDPEFQRQLLAYFQRVDNYLYLLAVRPGGGPGREPVIGSVALTGGSTTRSRHVVQLGMGVQRNVWGRGIGGLLLEAALDWCRANPVIHRVELQVFADNPVALELYRSRGFVDEGVLRAEALVGGAFHDLIGMGQCTCTHLD